MQFYSQAYPLPQGMCWDWDPFLLLLHGVSDALVCLAALLALSMAVFSYRAGRFKTIYREFPKLWRWGWGFVGLTALLSLGKIMEVWIGGVFYTLTGLITLLTAIIGYMFVWKFCVRLPDIVRIGIICSLVIERQKLEGTLSSVEMDLERVRNAVELAEGEQGKIGQAENEKGTFRAE